MSVTRRTRDRHPMLDEVSRYPRITDAELHALARRVKAGTDPGTGRLTPDAIDARNAIVCANLRLAIKYAARRRPRPLDFDDALSAALDGLIRAAERYDPDRLKADGQPHKFGTVADLWMRQRAGQAVEHAPAIWTPWHIRFDIARVRRLVESGEIPAPMACHARSLAERLGRTPSVAEAVIDGYRCRDALANAERVLSRESEEGGKSETDPADRRESDHDARLDTADHMARVRAVLETLTPVERDAVSLHYGIDGEGPMDYEQAARRMGMSGQGVRGAGKRAVRKLAMALGGLDSAPPAGRESA